MPFLVIAGLTIPVLEGQAEETTERQGLSARAVDGTLLSSYSTEAGAWKFTSGLLLQAELDALEAASALGAHVSCSGDALEGTVVCEVLLGRKPYVNVEGGDGKGFMRTVEIGLREATASDSSPVVEDATEWVL